MDLSSMLNDGPAPGTKASQTSRPEARHNGPPAVPSMPGAPHGQPSYGSHASNQSTPPHGSRPAGGPLSRQSTGLTPLQTPSQTPGGAQYPFAQQPAQSPAAPHPSGQQYQSYGPYSATTPGARPPSHGYQYSQPSPSQYQSYGLPPGAHAQHTSSLSPTPPSHHSHTPHSVRQSPLSVMPHGQQQPLPLQPLHYQHSQPSTPLGPPPLQYQRTSNHSQQDIHSPYHQRTFSGASNGMIAGSPAQHHPGIGNLVDSPSAYNRQSPHLRRTSDYLAHVDRERSLSVSPKTKIPPRPPSLGSRHSSHGQESYSARSSLQHQTSFGAVIPGHVQTPTQPSHQSVAQPPPLPTAYSQHSEVSQHPSLSAQAPYSASAFPDSEPPLSAQANNQQPQLAIQHQPQRMDMNHLLTPATSVTSMDGSNDGAPRPAKQRKVQDTNIFMKPSPKPKKPAVAAPPPPQEQAPPQIKTEVADEAIAQAVQQQQAPARVLSDVLIKEELETAQPPESKKRPAESEPSTEEPPAKRGKKRKYAERPIWARLARTNPRFNEQLNGANGAPPNRPQPTPKAQHVQQPARANGMPAPAPAQPVPQHQHQAQSNGHPQQANGNMSDSPPWLQNPPLDHDLIRARQLFGSWEKSICWNTPFVDMEKVVADWLYTNLASLQDVGNDPREGSVEIEAKIGRIMRKEVDERINVPVRTATVLDPVYCEKYARFESQMEVDEHAAMNKFLNATLQETMQKGRVTMQYKHPKETDSFRLLSPAGFQALPLSMQKRPNSKGRNIKLRTTTDSETGQVKARIVKIPIDNLHIFNPAHAYDCRISINLEVNLERPDLHPEDLVEPLNLDDGFKRGGDATPDRKKDRLSYKHLAYSIDLTRVDVKGMPAKFELELEVDAGALREQMQAIEEKRDSGFGVLVGGFLDNATFLMRQRAG